MKERRNPKPPTTAKEKMETIELNKMIVSPLLERTAKRKPSNGRTPLTSIPKDDRDQKPNELYEKLYSTYRVDLMPNESKIQEQFHEFSVNEA